MNSEKIQELLANGKHIAYSPLSGDVGIFDDGYGFQEISIADFLDARKSGLILLTSTTKVHKGFRGRVDIYHLSDKDKL